MASFMQGFDDVDVSDHDLVAPEHIRRALMAGELVFVDGATQVFEADGGTTYVENGRPTRGEWCVDHDGHFGSFWPPSYRASYDLRWRVEDGAIVGFDSPNSSVAPSSTAATGFESLAGCHGAGAGEGVSFGRAG